MLGEGDLIPVVSRLRVLTDDSDGSTGRGFRTAAQVQVFVAGTAAHAARKKLGVTPSFPDRCGSHDTLARDAALDGCIVRGWHNLPSRRSRPHPVPAVLACLPDTRDKRRPKVAVSRADHPTPVPERSWLVWLAAKPWDRASKAGCLASLPTDAGSDLTALPWRRCASRMTYFPSCAGAEEK